MQPSKESGQAVEENKNEKKNVISKSTWEDIKKREQSILEQERKVQNAVFNKIYERRIGEKVWITSLDFVKILVTCYIIEIIDWNILNNFEIKYI